MGLLNRVFKKESIANYMQSDEHLTKTLSAKDLLGLGVGAVIGTGIFILPGTVAATTAGPAVVISFIIAALISGLVAMAYSEMASALPVAGSAYSYGNIIFGEIIGWILGWALILEYFLAVAAVATSWSAYFANLVAPIFKMPKAISGPFNPAGGTYINLIAVVVLLVLGILLYGGMKESKRLQNGMVLLKIAIILLFIGVGIFYIKSGNYHPFVPARSNGAFGIHGILTGASMVFFAFLGFDALSSSAAEVKNPKRNIPIGIFGTLIIAAILYALVAFVLTGMVNYKQLNVADPVAFALQMVGKNGVAFVVTIGALVGMFTMMYTMLYASSRLVYAIGRDGLLPGHLGKLNKKGEPSRALLIATIVVMIFGGLVPLDRLVALVNIGTLLAFIVVSLGIIPLRKRKDLNHTGYKMPFYPVLPLISAGFSFFLMTQLQVDTLVAAAVWFAIGIVIYLAYGVKHSKLNKQ
ncbi:APC family permease [Weissella viridescens]|uniref:APC family permease n=1 Tax=Weissella viridescens TaxID=1629 RepID=UPI001745E9EA|nr:amino acid permease [Weissella viridescens]MBX4173168.1 amino acid permease [Weissella viridescens]MCB6840484.1 amino acid permease [Weissella viridescens]MCB6847217.1 amino acid permease [Weissella viridescens]QOD86091.1 amino acid permease [Weissella viridescens]